MSFFLMLFFLAFLIYVSYFKIVFMLFKGDQYNKIFATFISTAIPVIGSAPAIIMASQYERKIGGYVLKINDYILRMSIIAIELVSVFLLFLPFFQSDSIYATGINLIFGLNLADVTVFKPAYLLVFLLVSPFISAIINCIYFKNNIHNVISYIFSLISALTVFVIALFADTSGEMKTTFALWLYCILNVAVMLLSIFSIIKIRNEFLSSLEKEEEQKSEETIPTVEDGAEKLPPIGTYKCAKCGKYVPKGTICECRKDKLKPLDIIMSEQSKKETTDFCVYCKKPLSAGEKCSCVGEGFGITIKPEKTEGRKCKYCGETLVGDSICVCEKIIKNSKPCDDTPDTKEPKTFFESDTESAISHVSDEMADLEKLIEERFSKVKSSFHSEDK